MRTRSMAGVLAALGCFLGHGLRDPVEAPNLSRVDTAWQRAAESVAAHEYRPSAAADGLQAPNRQQGFRTYFDGRGIRVVDRTAAGAPELLSLELSGFGRKSALQPLAPGALSAAGERVEIQRPGIVEWYVNRPSGLEQGFTLAGRPTGEGPLVLELTLSGAKVSGGGNELRLHTSSGRALSYGKLEAYDARKRALPVALATRDPQTILLRVEDRDAAYPIVIDPILSGENEAAITPSQSTAGFARAVDGAGDINGDGYDDLIVGAPRYDAGATDEGAVFLFLGGPGGIATQGVEAADTQLEGHIEHTNFGTSVAGAGDVNGDGYDDVIVGAPGYGTGPTWDRHGAALVYYGGPGGIPDGDPSTADALLESDQESTFGVSVSGAGDVNADGYDDVIVGDSTYQTIYENEGAAFVFHGSASGIASGDATIANARVVADEPHASMGVAVSDAGDVDGDGYADVLIGAPRFDDPEVSEGAVFVFHGSSTGITGGTVSAADGRVESNVPELQLGCRNCVAGAGDVNADGFDDIILGMPGFDSGETDEGVALVFHGSASGIGLRDPSTADAWIEADQSDAHLGSSVSALGDVDEDGYGDVIVGANSFSTGVGPPGMAFVFSGGPMGVGVADPSMAIAEIQPQTQYSEAFPLAHAGDLDGDGKPDLVIGVPESWDHPDGAALVYLPEPTTPGTWIVLTSAVLWLRRRAA